jgi:CPA1 family monovalent cation:H+ antiporter
LHQKYKVKQNRIQSTRVPDTTEQNASVTVFNQFTRIELEMLVRERELTYRLRKQGKVTEEILHKIEREIDFEEARIRLELFQQ